MIKFSAKHKKLSHNSKSMTQYFDNILNLNHFKYFRRGVTYTLHLGCVAFYNLVTEYYIQFLIIFFN